MRTRRYLLPFFSIPLLFTYTWFAFNTPAEIQRAFVQLTPEPTPLPLPFPFAEDSWITVDLPPNATQLDYGWELYRLVCSACHAYDGTGLTDRWRSTWGVEDQNCWQSKCHASNHPPDGFELPIAPAIIGSGIRAQFATAFDLYVYNLNTMPWHVPGTMAEEEVWAVTAFVLQLNRIDPGPVLNAETAREIRISTQAPSATPAPTAEPTPDEPTPSEASSTLVIPATQTESEDLINLSKPNGFMQETFLFVGLILMLFVIVAFVFLLFVR